jgi:hypothetical protein
MGVNCSKTAAVEPLPSSEIGFQVLNPALEWHRELATLENRIAYAMHKQDPKLTLKLMIERNTLLKAHGYELKIEVPPAPVEEVS